MRKVLALVVAAGLMATATSAMAGIAGSKHDISATLGTPGTNTTQICVYCHAPHGALTMNPLWNRNNPGGAGFTLYSGVNMASVSNSSGFTSDSTSLFCMSCHDGNTAMSAVHNSGALIKNAASGGAGDAGLALVGGKITKAGPLLGTDLRGTHPVNFIVAASDTQNDLWVAGGTTTMGGGAGTTATTFPLFKLKGDRATSRSLECGSCHAVHDTTVSPFLRYTMSGSKLCLGCHNK